MIETTAKTPNNFFDESSGKPFSSFFWGFILIHAVGWIVLAVLCKPNFPLDVVECFIYGQEGALASGKHPPLPSWITVGLASVVGRSIAPYLASQIFVFFAFYSIWRLASKMLPPFKALLAVCSMEFYTYFTFYSLEFNNSISLIGCWSLAVLCFYLAVEEGKQRYWLATGLFLGLGVLGKYSGFILVLVLLLFMAYEPKARRYWKTPGPYLTTLVAFLLFLPHFFVIVQSNFATLEYVAKRVADEKTSGYDFGKHFLMPLRFTLTQIGILLPIGLFFLWLGDGKFRIRKTSENERFNARFLFFLILVPFVIQIAICAVFSLKLGTIYGSHLWIFLGLFLAFFLEIDNRKLSLKKLALYAGIAMVLMMSVSAFRDVTSPYLRKKPSRVHYPGHELAAETEERWHRRFSSPCPNLVGEWWLTGMVVAYGNDKPSVFCYIEPDIFDVDKVLSIWSTPDKAAKEGGICLWQEDHYPEKIPPHLLEAYPNAEIQEPMVLPFSTGAKLQPLRVGMAIIPPPQSQ